MMPLCTYVDDSLEEAILLANQLKRQGMSIPIFPMMPADTTSLTYKRIKAAKPNAAMIDYSLKGRPGTKSEELACQLLSHQIATVIVTKDRNLPDRGGIYCHGKVIPVYLKQRLAKDAAYVTELIQSLGAQNPPLRETNDSERLHLLQEKHFIGKLSVAERTELRILLSRLKLEESAETERIETAQTKLNDDLGSLISLIQDVTNGLKNEVKRDAVSSRRKRP